MQLSIIRSAEKNYNCRHVFLPAISHILADFLHPVFFFGNFAKIQRLQYGETGSQIIVRHAFSLFFYLFRKAFACITHAQIIRFIEQTRIGLENKIKIRKWEHCILPSILLQLFCTNFLYILNSLVTIILHNVNLTNCI